MEFQRKSVPFLHKGMNWNSPVDKLAEGQMPWCKNARVLSQGTISAAHGHSQFTDVSAANSQFQYVHTISRLNILNPDFDHFLAKTFVIGVNQELLVGQDDGTLSYRPDLNPVWTPKGQYGAFSGNPLSVVDAQPAGAGTAWKYIGDSQQMVTVGYYQTDFKGWMMARALTIGLPVPVNVNPAASDPTSPIVPLVENTGPGTNLTAGGNYQWMFAFRRVPTGARSNPSAPTRVDVINPGLSAMDSNGNHVPFSAYFILPQVPMDPQQPGLGHDPNVVVDVYRFGGDIYRWALVGSGAGGSVFHDNISDESLLAAPAPPQATDASTGLTRFNLFQPFVTQDIAWKGQATIQDIILDPPQPGGVSGHIWQLWWTGGPYFNPNWLAGSTIHVVLEGSVNTASTAFTIYQVVSNTVIELTENAGQQGFSNGQPVTWDTPGGTLQSGQPLAHLWGPYGIGQSGSYIFACGDPNGPGTLYWTNGNDPDSTDIVNNIIVSSPSERLVTGCVYDGQPFCWSTERQFAIQPSLTVFGQFTTQEVAGAKGCWLEWSLSVQSNGFADQSVTWRGKDGIYDWSSNGLQRLSDPLYPFFPHDGSPGIAPETIMPFIGANSHKPERVGNIDDTQPKYHRMCWFHGLLFYDFVALDMAAGSPVEMNVFSTLVWDTVNLPGGWVSLDQPFADTTRPVMRAVEVGANSIGNFSADDENDLANGIIGPAGRGGNMKIAWGSIIYDYYGFTRGFETRVITRAEDLGDSRAQKRWGDFWLDCTPLNEFTVYPLAGFHHCQMEPIAVPGPATTPDFCPAPKEPGERAQFILDFAEPAFAQEPGAALMSPALGLDIFWTAIDGQFTAALNQWQPSFVLKPEVISFRASDPDDLGQLQAKYFTGFNLEANTFGEDCILDVLIDGSIVSQQIINHDGQSEHPYAITPKAGYETQLQMSYPQDINGQPVTWQLFKINWIFEVWPDAVARDSFFSDLGYVGSKFIQGLVLPMETGGNPVSFNVMGDCGQQATMGPVSTPDLCKMDLAFSFSPCNTSPSEPFIASSVQIQPSGPARFWYDQARWIWEPEPELAATWQTQPTDFDLPGWHSQRDCYIAYRGGTGAPTLYITTEYGTEAYLLDYVGPNVYTRSYRVLKPQKAKWRSFRVESCGLLRLYIKDCEIRVKAWGDNGAYKSFAPFGDLSRANGGARI